MQGAKYTVEYYDSHFETKDYASHKGQAKRTWVYQTDAKGKIKFNIREYKVGGDDLYYDKDKNITFPLGTYIIYESEPPTGYNKSDQIFNVRLCEDATQPTGVRKDKEPDTEKDSATGKETMVAKEDVIRGGVKIEKRDASTRALSAVGAFS